MTCPMQEEAHWAEVKSALAWKIFVFRFPKMLLVASVLLSSLLKPGAFWVRTTWERRELRAVAWNWWSKSVTKCCASSSHKNKGLRLGALDCENRWSAV